MGLSKPLTFGLVICMRPEADQLVFKYQDKEYSINMTKRNVVNWINQVRKRRKKYQTREGFVKLNQTLRWYDIIYFTLTLSMVYSPM